MMSTLAGSWICRGEGEAFQNQHKGMHIPMVRHSRLRRQSACMWSPGGGSTALPGHRQEPAAAKPIGPSQSPSISSLLATPTLPVFFR